jgi:hypothetical protein
MKVFRVYMVAIFATIFVYTILVGNNHGWNLIPLFFGDIAAMNWAGQFNLDFSFLLTISCLWVCWRNKFSGVGFLLGFFAIVGGATFLSVYLLIVSLKANSIKEILIGENK